MRSLLLIALLALAACAHMTPPGPEPVDPPSPDPGPAATPCERSCAKADELGGCNGAGGPNCVEACERYEALGGELARNPECQAKASTCEQRAMCRSGYP
jgi:hypothetical protein